MQSNRWSLKMHAKIIAESKQSKKGQSPDRYNKKLIRTITSSKIQLLSDLAKDHPEAKKKLDEISTAESEAIATSVTNDLTMICSVFGIGMDQLILEKGNGKTCTETA